MLQEEEELWDNTESIGYSPRRQDRHDSLTKSKLRVGFKWDLCIDNLLRGDLQDGVPFQFALGSIDHERWSKPCVMTTVMSFEVAEAVRAGRDVSRPLEGDDEDRSALPNAVPSPSLPTMIER